MALETHGLSLRLVAALRRPQNITASAPGKAVNTSWIGAGFKDVRRYDWRQTEHKDYDDFSQAYIPHMDKENGLLISLNIEATK